MTTDSTAPPSPDTPPGIPATPPAVPTPHPHTKPALSPPITLPQNIAPPNAEERNMGMLIHLLAIFTSWLGPLILWLVRKDQSPFIDHHGKEALNFQITYTIVAFGVGLVGMVLGIVTMGVGILLLIPLWLVMFVFVLIWEIQACVSASRGEWYHYPCTIRFIR